MSKYATERRQAVVGSVVRGPESEQIDEVNGRVFGDTCRLTLNSEWVGTIHARRCLL